MKQAKAYLAILVAVLLCGAALAGCSQQAEKPAEEVDPVQAQKEQLMSEVESAIGNEGYQSVTVDAVGSLSIQPAGQDAGKVSGEDYEEFESSEDESSFDEGYADEYGSDESGEEGGDIVISAKCDRSGDAVRMQTRVEEGDTVFEFYAKGDDAVMVMDSQAASGKLAEFKMPQYGDVLSLIRYQMADLSLFRDAVDDIQKEEGDGGATYKVVCDPAKFASANAAGNPISQMPKTAKLKTVELEYHVNADNLLTELTAKVAGSDYASSYKSTFHDYNATDVEDGPEATISVKQMITGESDESESSGDGSGDVSYDEEYSE